MGDIRLDLFGDKKNDNSSSYGATDMEGSQILGRQQEIIKAQESSIHHLSEGVLSVRKIAEMVHGEVNAQDSELDALGTQMDRLEGGIENADGRTHDMRNSAYTIKSFCLLLWPLVLLIVLVVEAIVHFIF